MTLGEDFLVIVPARGGSKGVPGKNKKLLQGIPLVSYTIRYALRLTTAEHIFLTTDSEEIAAIGEQEGLKVPSLRPEHLSSDDAGTYEVVRYCMERRKEKGLMYNAVIILQPTSPFRLIKHMHEALALYSGDVDMVMSVVKTKSNPYYLLMEEDESGFLHKSKGSTFTRRQDIPDVYEINGSIYICNARSIESHESFATFTKIRKYEMNRLYNLDIDDELDWTLAEMMASHRLIAFDQ
jgi:CMP-N,N'-diacetyllegionaminic acid synthase